MDKVENTAPGTATTPSYLIYRSKALDLTTAASMLSSLSQSNVEPEIHQSFTLSISPDFVLRSIPVRPRHAAYSNFRSVCCNTV